MTCHPPSPTQDNGLAMDLNKDMEGDDPLHPKGDADLFQDNIEE
jgi:hypothetical protein